MENLVDEAEDWEESYVYLNFEDFDDLILLKEGISIELRDLQSTAPVCIINGKKDDGTVPCNLILSGKYETSLGSRVFFPKEYINNFDHEKGNEDHSIKISSMNINFSISKIEKHSDS